MSMAMWMLLPLVGGWVDWWTGGWEWVDVECSQVIDQIYATHITMGPGPSPNWHVLRKFVTC